MESFFEFFEKGGAALVVFVAGGVLKVLQQFPLFSGKIFRHFHHHPQQQIADAAAAEVRDALALDAQDVAGLCALLDGVRHAPVEGGDFYLRAERGLCKRNRQFIPDIHAVPLKQRMRPHADLHNEVARGAAVASGVSFAGDADLNSDGRVTIYDAVCLLWMLNE